MMPQTRQMPLQAPPMRPQQKPPRHSVGMYRRIATLFLLLTAVVVALVAYVVLSRGTVVVLSKQEPADADFIVDVAETPTGDEVRGQVLQSSDSLVETFQSSSVVKIDTAATGRVRITSTLYRPQTLIATTRLLTPDGVLYHLKDTVVVPANGSVVADVYADQVGAAGKAENTTFTIPGLNPDSQRFFTVQTEGDFSGGVHDQHMITRTDVDTAVDSLLAKLKVTLAESLRAKAADAGLQSGKGEFISYEIVRKTTDKPIGDESTEYTLTVGVKATAVFYDTAAFHDRVVQRITEHLPYGRALLALDENAITTEVEKVDMVSGRANLRVSAKGTSVLSKDSPALRKDKLLGVTVDSAKKYLERIEGVSSASVRVSPFWVGRLPNVPEHITIEVR